MIPENPVARDTGSGSAKAPKPTTITSKSVPSNRIAPLPVHKIVKRTRARKSPSTSSDSSCEKKGVLGGKKSQGTGNKCTTPSSKVIAETPVEQGSMMTLLESSDLDEAFLDERVKKCCIPELVTEPQIQLKEVDVVDLSTSWFPVHDVELNDVFSSPTNRSRTSQGSSQWISQTTATSSLLNLSNAVVTPITPVANINNHEEENERTIGEQESTGNKPAAEEVLTLENALHEFEEKQAISEAVSVSLSDGKGQLHELKEANVDRKLTLQHAKVPRKLPDQSGYAVGAVNGWRAISFLLAGLVASLVVPLSFWFSLNMNRDGSMIPPPT